MICFRRRRAPPAGLHDGGAHALPAAALTARANGDARRRSLQKLNCRNAAVAIPLVLACCCRALPAPTMQARGFANPGRLGAPSDGARRSVHGRTVLIAPLQVQLFLEEVSELVAAAERMRQTAPEQSGFEFAVSVGQVRTVHVAAVLGCCFLLFRCGRLLRRRHSAKRCCRRRPCCAADGAQPRRQPLQ